MDFNELLSLAESGDPDHQLLLARLYGAGEIEEVSTLINPDLEKCFFWVLQSAKSGNTRAKANLGNMYCKGIGTEPNISKGFYWYSAAAEDGDERSLFGAGLMLLLGNGTAQNIDQGIKFLYQAAQGGFTEAMSTLGSTFLEGKLVEQDLSEAKYWLQEAAKKLDANAQYNLGILYMNHQEHSLKRDIKAYKWLFAAKQNNAHFLEHTNSALAILSSRLSINEINSAKEMAQEYL